MQAKKSADVEIICSDKIDQAHLGVFYNSFRLTNYEWVVRNQTEKKGEEKKEEDEPKDPRLDRKSKLLDSFVVSHPAGDYQSCDNFTKQKIMAEATVFARDLANVRGSVATPGFME